MRVIHIEALLFKNGFFPKKTIFHLKSNSINLVMINNIRRASFSFSAFSSETNQIAGGLIKYEIRHFYSKAGVYNLTCRYFLYVIITLMALK